MDEDPVVRARFWDMQHDAVPAHEGDGPRWTRFREAVVAFPVRYEDVEGDLPTYMYADDPVYVAFGREVMGWPVRGGHIELEPGEPAVPAPGQRLAGRLVRHGRAIMEMRIELTGRIVALDDEAPPRWLAWKVIPDVAHAAAALSQLVVTGPERIHHRRAWEATASLAFAEGPEDELHHLRPREIVAAQLWTEVDLTIGWGRVLRDLRDSGEPRGDEAPTGG
jgi:acetoacetate decarboxylase